MSKRRISLKIGDVVLLKNEEYIVKRITRRSFLGECKTTVRLELPSDGSHITALAPHIEDVVGLNDGLSPHKIMNDGFYWTNL